jgi:hypothetical protein
MVELGAWSIYRVRARWSRIWVLTCGGRRWRRTGARECVSPVVASSPAMMGLPQRVTAARCKGRATRQATAKARRRWALLSTAVSKGRGTVAGWGGIQLTAGEEFFYWAMLIWRPRCTNHGERPTGHRRRARGGIFFSLTFTVPWEIQFMTPDRATSEQFFSNFCITTSSSMCTKVVGLSSNYNFATRCSHKKSLDHV